MGFSMATAILNSKGRMTIPKSVRDQLNLKPGDRLEFVEQPNGRVLRRKLNLREIDHMVGDAAMARQKK